MDDSKSQQPDRPHDASETDGDEYRLAPLPESFADATSPAYRSDDSRGERETYAVGPEVDEPTLSVGAESWREAAAGIRRERDEFDVLPPEPLPNTGKLGRLAAHREAELRLKELADRRIGTLDDPARFTLSGLFVLITGVSVLLAIGTRLPRPVFAFLMGGAALITLVLAKWIQAGSALFNLAWGMLLGLYLLVSLFAMLHL